MLTYKEKESLQIAALLEVYLKNGGKIKYGKELILDRSRKPTGFSERLAE